MNRNGIIIPEEIDSRMVEGEQSGYTLILCALNGNVLSLDCIRTLRYAHCG